MNNETLKKIVLRLYNENLTLKKQIRYDLKTAISKTQKDELVKNVIDISHRETLLTRETKSGHIQLACGHHRLQAISKSRKDRR